MRAVGDSLWQCQSEQCGVVSPTSEVQRTVKPGFVIQVCPQCGGPVVEVVDEKGEVIVEAPIPSFASALAYPFHGWGLVVLGTGTFIVGLLAFGMPFLYSYVVTMLIYGYVLNYFFDVVLSTANGQDDPPGFPVVTSWWDDVLRPIMLMVSTTLLCFLPAFLWFVGYLVRCWYEGWVPELDEPMCVWGVVGLAIASSFYYPMALLAVVMYDARRAASPRCVIPAIGLLFGPYLVVCGFMIVTGLVKVGFQLLLNGDYLWVHFLGVFLNLWSAMAGMRLLGLLYRKNKEKLAWF